MMWEDGETTSEWIDMMAWKLGLVDRECSEGRTFIGNFDISSLDIKFCSFFLP